MCSVESFIIYMTRSRAYCLTLNNYTEAEYEAFVGNAEKAAYAIIGKEVGENGTPHLQCYFYFKNAKSFSAVKKIFPRAHIEKAKGDAEQNKEYCSKEGSFEEYGNIPLSNKRKGEVEKERWAKARKSACEGKIEDVPDDIFIKYYRTLKAIKKDYMTKVDDAEDVSGVWIYGEAGVGKSRKARADYPEAYMKMCNKWWDGYQDEEYVIVDDVDPNHSCLGHHFKIWGDRYAFLAETKGGAMMIRPKKIIVTSQYSVEEIWSDLATRDAINRRFEVIHLE